VLEDLSRFFRVTLFWYNPNIFPQEEFNRRLSAQKKLLQAMDPSGRIALLEIPRDSDPWYRAAAGLEDEPEGGRRCTECFRLRLREAAQAAAEGGFDWFCSTLTLSRHKDPVRINALGEQFAREYGVRWLPSEFKKRGRELRSKELCEQYGIYRQNYCGCEFSLHPTKTTNEVQP
jgi:predicted adenine nucleotide alpha hydrolase (AANH) superfamily ATPase